MPLHRMIPPTESYSRELDMHVQMEERTYGYNMPPPPADTGDYDMKSRQSKVMYSRGQLRG
jgi:hypothetical protein